MGATATRMNRQPLRDPGEIKLDPLDRHPRFKTLREELAQIEQRMLQADRRQEIARARQRGQDPPRSAEQRAQDLLAGGSIVILPPDAELAAAAEELAILNRARIAKLGQLEQLRGELSSEACAKFARLNADALLAVLAALEDLHTVLEVGRAIRGRLYGMGYLVNTAALPVHLLPEQALLGDPQPGGLGAAARFRQWLATVGIL